MSTPKKPFLGATGKFPHGKLNDHDEGELIVALHVEGGKIVMEFGKRISWLALTAEDARHFARTLIAKAEQLEVPK